MARYFSVETQPPVPVYNDRVIAYFFKIWPGMEAFLKVHPLVVVVISMECSPGRTAVEHEDKGGLHTHMCEFMFLLHMYIYKIYAIVQSANRNRTIFFKNSNFL